MKYKVNAEEQRRRDSMWDGRKKAVCVCGEAIADYAGTWLHVIGGERYCEVMRPVATPAKPAQAVGGGGDVDAGTRV